MQEQRSRQLLGPLAAVDQAGIEWRAVAALVHKIEERDPGEVLTALDEAEADLVVVTRIGLATKGEIEEVERIARVGHQADRLREPQFAVVVGVVEVDLTDDPHAALDARLDGHEIDAAVEAERDDRLKLGHVGARAVGVGPVGHVEALGDVERVARDHVLVDAVGVEAEGQVRVHLERGPQAHLEADDADERNLLLELVLELRQLEGDERRRLAHHHLEQVERIFDERHAEAAAVRGAVRELRLPLLLRRRVGVHGRQGLESGLGVVVGLGPVPRVDAQRDVVVLHRAVLVAPLVEVGHLREPEPAHGELDVDTGWQGCDPRHQVVQRGHRFDHAPHALGLLSTELLEQVNDPDRGAGDIGEHRHRRVEEREHGPDLRQVRLGLVDGRLEEARQEAAHIEPDVAKPDLGPQVHLLDERRGGIDSLVATGSPAVRLFDPLLFLHPLDQADVGLVARAGSRGAPRIRLEIGGRLLRLLDLGPRRAGAPVDVEVGVDPRDGQILAGGRIADRQFHRQVRDGLGVVVDGENPLEASRLHLGPCDAALGGVGVDVADRIPAHIAVDRVAGNRRAVKDEHSAASVPSLDDAVDLLEPRKLDLVPLRLGRGGQLENESGLGQVVGLAGGGEIVRAKRVIQSEGSSQSLGQLRGADRGAGEDAIGGLQRDPVVPHVVLDVDDDVLRQRLVDRLGQDGQRDIGRVRPEPRDHECVERKSLADGDHRSLEDERRGAERHRARGVEQVPAGVLVRSALGDEHEHWLAAQVQVVVGVEGAAPGPRRHGVDAVLLRDRLVLDEHAVSHLELDAVDDAHARQCDVRPGGHADGNVEGLVLRRRRDLELELVVLLGVDALDVPLRPEEGRQRRDAAGLRDSAGCPHDILPLVVHDPHRVRSAGGVRLRPDRKLAGLGARVDHVESDGGRKPCRQLVVAVDAGRLVVAFGGRGLRAFAGVVEVLRVDVGEPGESAADLVGGRQAEEEQAARQLRRLHRRDFDERVRVGVGLGHVEPLVVHFGGDVIAVTAGRAHDPPDLLVGGRRRGRIAAPAGVGDGRIGLHERRDVRRELVDGDRPVGLTGRGVDHVLVVCGLGRPLRIDDLPVLRARIPPLRVVLGCARERRVEAKLGLELAGRAAGIARVTPVSGAVHLQVEAVGQAEAEAQQHLPAHLQPQTTVERRAHADARQGVEFEAHVDAGVEHLLAEPEDNLEGVGPADVVREHVPLLVHEDDADVFGPRRRHHGIERAIHADRVVLEQDVGILGPEVLEDRLPHHVEDAFARTPHLVPHVEEPAGAEAEDRTDRAADFPLHERQRNLVEPLERALDPADRGIELVEDHRWVADEVEERLLRPEQILRVLQVRRKGEQFAPQVGRGEIQPRLPCRERDVVGIDGAVRRQEAGDRSLRLFQAVEGVEVVGQARHREVETRGMVLDEAVDARIPGLLHAGLRGIRRGEVVENRHLDGDGAAEGRGVVDDRERIQLAAAGHDVEDRSGWCPGRARECHDERPVLNAGLPVSHVHAELCRELQILAVHAEGDRERRAVGQAAAARAVVAVEKRLVIDEVVADREHAGGVDHDVERSLRIAVGQGVNPLRQGTAQLFVILHEVHIEVDGRRLARAVADVDAVGLVGRVVGDAEVGGSNPQRRFQGPLELLRRGRRKLSESIDPSRKAGVERDHVGERLVEQRQILVVERL